MKPPSSVKNYYFLPSIEEIKQTFQDYLYTKQALDFGIVPDEFAKDFQKLLSLKSYIESLPYETSEDELRELVLNVFEYAIHLYDYDDLPKVLSHDDYEKLQNKKLITNGGDWSEFKSKLKNMDGEYFRGTRRIVNHARMLCDYDYHTGMGLVANGLYATNDFDEAVHYVADKPELSHSRVLRFKLATDKIVDDELIMMIQDQFLDGELILPSFDENATRKLYAFKIFMKNLSTEELSIFKRLFYNDASLFAIYLGYDCLSMSNGDNITILNRGTIAVEKSEFDRICQSTKTYNRGVIDHEFKNSPFFNLEK